MKKIIRKFFVKMLREWKSQGIKVVAYAYDNETGKGFAIVKRNG